MSTYYTTEECFKKAKSLSSLVKKRIRGVAEIIREIDASTQHFIILSDEIKETISAVTGDLLFPGEDKENFDPLLHSSSLLKSIASEESCNLSDVGAPLPLDKIANLSSSENGETVLLLPTSDRVSVRSFYQLGADRAMPERRARFLLSNLLRLVKSGEASWLREGVTVLIPCEEKGDHLKTVCTGLSIHSNIMALNIKCIKDLYASQLPQLDSLRTKLCAGRSQLIINQEFESVYSLNAIKLPNLNDALALVQYRVAWQIARQVLEFPTIGALGNLTVRPVVGWRNSDIHFLYKGIQRLKFLVAAIQVDSCNWMPEVEDFDIGEFYADILSKFCRLATTADQTLMMEKSAGGRLDMTSGPINEALLGEICDKEFEGRWKAAVKLRNRDVTEVMWLLLKVIDSRANLNMCLQSIFKFLIEKNIPYKVEKSNFSELASILRRMSADGTRFLAPPLNRLSLLAEVGLFSLLNDHRAILEAICRDSCPNLAGLHKSMRHFLETGTTLAEKMKCLERLHLACEFASLLSTYAGHQSITDSVKQVLKALGDDAPVPHELTFKLPSADLRPILSRQHPTLWSVQFTVGGRRRSIVKHLFQRPVRDVIGIVDLTLARFTHLEMLWQEVDGSGETSTTAAEMLT